MAYTVFEKEREQGAVVSRRINNRLEQEVIPLRDAVAMAKVLYRRGYHFQMATQTTRGVERVCSVRLFNHNHAPILEVTTRDWYHGKFLAR